MKFTKHPTGFRLERVEDGVLHMILAIILAMIFFHGEPSVIHSRVGGQSGRPESFPRGGPSWR